MSPPKVEFFWDVGSPYTYLASTQIEAVARRCDTVVKWRPFLLGAVFRETGNRPPAEVPAKATYMLKDLGYWAGHYGVKLSFPSCFPANSLMPMRAAMAADWLGKGKEFARAIMNLYWVEGMDPSLAESVRRASEASGLDPARVMDLVGDPVVKEALKKNTLEAVERGTFGAPTFFVQDRMFWGNDRLLLLEAYLQGKL